MHHTSTTGSRLAPRGGLPDLLGALLLLALAQAVPALAAGAVHRRRQRRGLPPLRRQRPQRRTRCASRPRGLAASTEYYVKVRISPTDSISGGTSRGFTWNPTTQQWVQERDEWSKLPSFTTDATGAYASGNTWTFFKFGDTTKPAEGRVQHLVSLRVRAAGGRRRGDHAQQRDVPRRHARGHDRASDLGDLSVPRAQRHAPSE